MTLHVCLKLDVFCECGEKLTDQCCLARNGEDIIVIPCEKCKQGAVDSFKDKIKDIINDK